MLSRAELKEISSMDGRNYFVSLYLNVDPMFNKKGDYMVYFKNMMKDLTGTLDTAVYRQVKKDLEKIDNYVLANKRLFRKGLVLISSEGSSLWKEYHLAVPVKSELIVDNTPYIKPLLDILDNYRRYAVLIVDRESARIFMVHLGDIVEYGEIHTKDIPGKHKKGGWFALSQDHYERHIDYHVGLHLKDVVDRFDSFLRDEQVAGIIIGGSDEAGSMVKGMLHKTVLDKIIGSVRIEMFAKPDEIMSKVRMLVSGYEKTREDETIEALIAKAMKNENAVLGTEKVISALEERRVMKLVVLKDFRTGGFACSSCDHLSLQKKDFCPYCKGALDEVDYLANIACEKAIRQDALVEIVSESKMLLDTGGIGAFLRF